MQDEIERNEVLEVLRNALTMAQEHNARAVAVMFTHADGFGHLFFAGVHRQHTLELAGMAAHTQNRILAAFSDVGDPPDAS